MEKPVYSTQYHVDNDSVYYGTGKYDGTGQEWDTNGMPADGQWHCWEFYVKLNSAPGIADGIFEMWIDGGDTHGNVGRNYLFTSHKDLAWSDQGAASNPRKGWNMVMSGGNVYNHWGTNTQQWYAMDDVVISKNYIGPDYIIGTPPAPTAPSTPTNLVLGSPTSNSLRLSWTASTDNVGATG